MRGAQVDPTPKGKINTVERSHDTLEITAIYRGYKSRMGKTEPYPLEIIAAHPAANISFSPNWGKIGPVGENIEIPSSSSFQDCIR